MKLTRSCRRGRPFYQHGGVDYLGVIRAFDYNVDAQEPRRIHVITGVQ